MIKIREGYFLVRKLCVITKNIKTQDLIVEKIIQNITYFCSNYNGSLICQCIIRNFKLNISPQKLKISPGNSNTKKNIIMFSNEFKKYINTSLIKNSNENINKNYLISNSFIDYNVVLDLCNNQQSNDHDDLYDYNNINNLSIFGNNNNNNNNNNYEYATNNQFIISNNSLVKFYNFIVNRLLTSDISQSILKLFECGIKYGGIMFTFLIVEKMIIDNNKIINSKDNKDLPLIINLFIKENNFKLLYLTINNIDNFKLSLIFKLLSSNRNKFMNYLISNCIENLFNESEVYKIIKNYNLIINYICNKISINNIQLCIDNNSINYEKLIRIVYKQKELNIDNRLFQINNLNNINNLLKVLHNNCNTNGISNNVYNFHINNNYNM